MNKKREEPAAIPRSGSRPAEQKLYRSIRWAIILKLLPVKKTNPRTRTVSPLLTAESLCKSVLGCQYTVTADLPESMAKAESDGSVRVKVTGPDDVVPGSPDTVPTRTCCCNFTFSAATVPPLNGAGTFDFHSLSGTDGAGVECEVRRRRQAADPVGIDVALVDFELCAADIDGRGVAYGRLIDSTSRAVLRKKTQLASGAAGHLGDQAFELHPVGVLDPPRSVAPAAAPPLSMPPTGHR